MNRATKFINLIEQKMGVSMEDMYKSGYSVSKISKILGIPYDKVFDKLEKAGLIKRII